MSETDRHPTDVVKVLGAPTLRMVTTDGEAHDARWLAKRVARAACAGSVIWLQGEGAWRPIILAAARKVFGRGDDPLPVRVVPSLMESSAVTQWDVLPGDVVLAFGPASEGDGGDYYRQRRVTLVTLEPVASDPASSSLTRADRARALVAASLELLGALDRTARGVVRALRTRGEAA